MGRASVAIAALAGANARGQDSSIGTAVIVGQVKIKETGQPLGYSVISLPGSSRQLFTTERGTFTLWNLQAGVLKIRVKHIGYSPRDTVFTLGAADTLHLDVALSVLAIQLPSVHVAGTCGTKPANEATAGILTELFDQVQQNAERYRLLADSNPFQLLVYRVVGTRAGNGKIVAFSTDTVLRRAFPPTPYEPRHLIRETPATDSTRAGYDLSVPEIADFADSVFTSNHCFAFAGQRKIDDDSVIAVEFEPVPSLGNEIDFRGHDVRSCRRLPTGTRRSRADQHATEAAIARHAQHDHHGAIHRSTPGHRDGQSTAVEHSNAHRSSRTCRARAGHRHQVAERPTLIQSAQRDR
jgi:hypothetical protein